MIFLKKINLNDQMKIKFNFQVLKIVTPQIIHSINRSNLKIILIFHIDMTH